MYTGWAYPASGLKECLAWTSCFPLCGSPLAWEINFQKRRRKSPSEHSPQPSCQLKSELEFGSWFFAQQTGRDSDLSLMTAEIFRDQKDCHEEDGACSWGKYHHQPNVTSLLPKNGKRQTQMRRLVRPNSNCDRDLTAQPPLESFDFNRSVRGGGRPRPLVRTNNARTHDAFFCGWARTHLCSGVARLATFLTKRIKVRQKKTNE